MNENLVKSKSQQKVKLITYNTSTSEIPSFKCSKIVNQILDEHLSEYDINDSLFSTNISYKEMTRFLSRFEIIYQCMKCGRVSTNLTFTSTHEVRNKCSYCNSRKLIIVSTSDILSSFYSFTQFHYNFASNNHQFGILEKYFSLYNGGTIHFSLKYPHSGDKVSYLMHLSTSADNFNIDNVFSIYYKSKVGIKYQRVKNDKSYFMNNLHDCIIVTKHLDISNNKKRFIEDLVIIRNDLIVTSFSGYRYSFIENDGENLILKLRNNNKHEDVEFSLTNEIKASQAITLDYSLLSSQKIDQDLYLNPLINEDQFQFYFCDDSSMVAKVLLMYATDHGHMIEELRNIYDIDATKNYRVTVPRLDVDSIFFYFYSIMKKKTRSYSLFGHSLSDVLLVMDKSMDEISIDSSCNDKLNFLNNLLQRKLSKTRVDLIDFFIENFGVYLVDRFFFNYRLESNEHPLYGQYGRSMHSDYFMTLASDLGFKSITDFHDSQKYKELSKDYDVIYSEYKTYASEARTLVSEKLLSDISTFYFEDTLHQYRLNIKPSITVDIFVPTLKLIIEYQGSQHYEETEYFTKDKSGENRFESQNRRDIRLREYALQNELILIEWPYTLEVTSLNFILIINKYLERDLFNFNKLSTIGE